LSVVETHEYKGMWWLPSDETEKRSGTLTVNKGEAALELIGHFGHELTGSSASACPSTRQT
jgi:ApeA N-terminal domain 1